MEPAQTAEGREFDLVVYGASGYVGRQVVKYLGRHARLGGLRWAIAGRDRGRLEALKEDAGIAVPVLVADSAHQADIDAIAARTRVVVNTAGPFALLGTPVVDACVRMETHYLDISGETPWIRNMIDRYHDAAAQSGIRIVPCCGFDSVPSDLGSYLVARHIQRSFGAPCRQVKAYFRMAGGFNGGTIASGMNQYETGGARLLDDPFLLNPPGAHAKAQIERNRDVAHAMFDVETQAWVGPFIMAPINTRVVRRSAALLDQWQEGYGPDFTYQEYLKYEPPFPMLKALAVTGGFRLAAEAMANPATRGFLRRVMPQPGQGPSERSMETGWFICELLGLAEDGRRARAVMRHQGDPGNRATARFIAEAALALALDEAGLPGGQARGGVLTPATAFGDQLAARLRESGMVIDVGT